MPRLKIQKLPDEIKHPGVAYSLFSMAFTYQLATPIKYRGGSENLAVVGKRPCGSWGKKEESFLVSPGALRFMRYVLAASLISAISNIGLLI